MALPAEREATYEDLFDLPDNMVGQIIHGQLIVQPRPAPKHALASSVLNSRIGGKYHRNGNGDLDNWWILFEPELHIGGHILVPDLAGWRRERLPVLPETAYFTITPDWICEVLSPSTAKLDRATKMPIYAKIGVKFVWLVDPSIQLLEVFELQNNHWVLSTVFKENDTVVAPPFNDLSFDLGILWN